MEKAEQAAVAAMAYVAGVEDLGLKASAEEVVLAESSSVVGAGGPGYVGKGGGSCRRGSGARD